MRVVVVGAAERARVAKVLAWAEKHVYHPGPGVPVPGDDRRFVAIFGGVRVVFTYTQTDRARFRHLSASLIDRKNALPNPAVIEEIAKMYGFTGGILDWDAKVKDECIVIFQQIAPVS